MNRIINTILSAIFFLLFTQAIGVLGTLFVLTATPTWYVFLHKPAFSPPDAVFAPVWIVLYLLLGLAAFLVFQKGWHKEPVREALIIFAGQMMLTVLWPTIFFGLRAPVLALIEMMLLWIGTLVLMRKFFKVSEQAMFLLIPYLLWVSFAVILNFAIVVLN